MTNEEAIEKLEELKTVAPNENYAFDCARQLAIKALKNQAKYERALDMAVECITDCNECPASPNCKGRLTSGPCNPRIIAVLKQIFGIEDDAK